VCDASINETCSTCAADCAMPETCDGLDNDCDGAIDNGFNVGAACDGADADLCNEGVMACSADHTTAVCSDTTGNTADLCNGVDDDCNGLIDDGLTCSTTTALTNGVAATGLTGGADRTYTLTVPAGVSTLTFRTSGGTGDADLYVRYGA